MKIIHSKVERGFTIIPDRVLTDARLSFRARGVLAYILSRPDGWETSAERLAAGAREGRDAVRTALRELEAVGYLRRSRVQDEKGRWATVQVVTDTPEPGTNPSGNPSRNPSADPHANAAPTTGFQPSVPQASLPSTENQTERDPSGSSRATTPARPLVAYFVRRHREVFGTDPSGDAKGALGKGVAECLEAGWSPEDVRRAIDTLLEDCALPPRPHLTSQIYLYGTRKEWDTWAMQ